MRVVVILMYFISMVCAVVGVQGGIEHRNLIKENWVMFIAISLICLVFAIKMEKHLDNE